MRCSALFALLLVIVARPGDSRGQSLPHDQSDEAAPVAVKEPSSTDGEFADIGPIESAAQLLSTLGVGQQVFDQFESGRPLNNSELEPLLRILVALQQFPLEKGYRWSIPDRTSRQIATSGKSLRGELLRLSGTLMSVETIPLPDALAERFEVDRLYRYEIRLSDGGTAIVMAPTIPRQLQANAKVNERVGFDGVFVKPTTNVSKGTDDEAITLLFAAARIAWRPATKLGSLGMDVSLFDNIKQNRAIAGAEAEAFYQMLAAAGRANLGALLAATQSQKWTIIPATSDRDQLAQVLAKMKRENPSLHFYFAAEPTDFTGELMAFEGQVYRCVRVEVTNRELVERLGFDHYYDLIVFIDLDYRLKLSDAAARAGDGAVERAGRPNVPTEVSSYPIAAAVREVPLGFPLGDRLKERVRVPGFFFKQWAYRSTAAAELHPTRPELTPLIVGPGVEWLSKPPSASSNWQAYAAAGFLFSLVFIGLLLWRAQRRDRQFSKTLRRDELPEFDE